MIPEIRRGSGISFKNQRNRSAHPFLKMRQKPPSLDRPIELKQPCSTFYISDQVSGWILAGNPAEIDRSSDSFSQESAMPGPRPILNGPDHLQPQTSNARLKTGLLVDFQP